LLFFVPLSLQLTDLHSVEKLPTTLQGIKFVAGSYKQEDFEKATYLVSHMVYGEGGREGCVTIHKNTFELLLILSVRDEKHPTAYLLPHIRPPFNHLSCLKYPQIDCTAGFSFFPTGVIHKQFVINYQGLFLSLSKILPEAVLHPHLHKDCTFPSHSFLFLLAGYIFQIFFAHRLSLMSSPSFFIIFTLSFLPWTSLFFTLSFLPWTSLFACY
jgi:hypothetical protein